MDETKELVSIKKLVILLLIKIGATSEEIALALDIHPANVRKIIPSGKVRKLQSMKEAS